jgi:hypothetical protein
LASGSPWCSGVDRRQRPRTANILVSALGLPPERLTSPRLASAIQPREKPDKTHGQG